MPGSKQEQAEELLERVDGIVLPEGVLTWPWQPFRLPDEAEEKDGKQIVLIKQLRTEQDRAKRLGLIRDILGLGDVEFRGNRLKRIRKSYLLYDHRNRLHKFGGAEGIESTIRQVMPDWNIERPQWGKLASLIQGEGLATMEQLQEATLDQICLWLLGYQGRRTKAVRTRKIGETRTHVRGFTEQERRVWSLRAEQRTFQEIGDMLKITKQAASDAFSRAKTKYGAITKSRSVVARSSIQDYDEMGGTKSSDL